MKNFNKFRKNFLKWLGLFLFVATIFETVLYIIGKKDLTRSSIIINSFVAALYFLESFIEDWRKTK